jgi:uncharacterized membrane protein required for colicin V production
MNDSIAWLGVIFSGANTVLLITVAFKFGHWMGSVNTTLAGLKEDVHLLNKRVFLRGGSQS